jgi:hypothetical protein
VLEYVAAIEFAGTATLPLTVMSMRPSPVAVAALRNFAVDGESGIARFVFEALFVGRVHVEPLWQALVTEEIESAPDGRVCPAPSLNCVAPIVRFQPPPVARPRASTTCSWDWYVLVWSSPFSVCEKEGLLDDDSESVEPPVTVAVTVTEAAAAAVAAASAAETATTSPESPRCVRILA